MKFELMSCLHFWINILKRLQSNIAAIKHLCVKMHCNNIYLIKVWILNNIKIWKKALTIDMYLKGMINLLELLFGVAITASFGFFYLGYWFAYFNAFTSLYHFQLAKEGNTVINDEDLFNSIISGLIPFGAIFGALAIEPVTKFGRRVALIIVAVWFTIGTGITMLFSFYSLAIGRFIMGLSAGAFTTVSPLMVNEISPVSISGTLGTLNPFMWVAGILIAYSLAFLAPYKENLNDNNFEVWRIVFGFPALVSFLQLILLLFVFNYDSPKYYQMIGDQELYNKVMSKIYKNKNKSKY